MTALISMTRRQLMLALACAVPGGGARAAPAPSTAIETITVDGVQVRMTRYMAPRSGKHPTVLLLHGSRGLDARMQAYEQYARDLADANIDTLLFTYILPEERTAIKQAGSAVARAVQYARFVNRWVSLVKTVAVTARDHERSSGHLGILGFSLGGFVAVAAASQPLFSVLSLFYAGLPAFYSHEIALLPPLLDIHGDHDQSVSLKEGSNLVATAKRLGGVADLVVFRGEGHGFDLDLANPHAAPARQQAIAFIERWIGQG